MSKPSDHLKFQYAELNKLNQALRTLIRQGIPEVDAAYQAVYKARGAAFGKLGKVQPRTTTLVKLLLGLSPGEIKLFQDAERGWLVESIPRPGAQPVYRYVSDEIAGLIIKGELTHDLEEILFTPEEEYIA